MSKSIFVFDPAELRYRFNDEHPFNQKRLELTVDLLQHLQALPQEQIVKPRPAAREELEAVHSEAYIETVQAMSVENPAPEWLRRAHLHGLTTGDTPYFPGMHETTSLIVGGSIAAAEEVMSGRADHALHLGGGLHHALQNKAAGFCVYNDASAAIAYIRRHYGAKVLYVDTDVHHGDGVQWSFYTEPEVCTFSIHESGDYLFPGTGSAGERGSDAGFGTCINLPMEPYTEDESWMECFAETLRQVVAAFKPDVIVSQHGCDAHAFDPLSHIHCSMAIYFQMPALIHQLAHEWCDGRWIALGGGGYDIWRVVPRAWSLLWLEMSDHPLIERLEADPALKLPKSWLDQWQKESGVELPVTWLDPVDTWPPNPRRAEITEKNRQMKELATLYLPNNDK